MRFFILASLFQTDRAPNKSPEPMALTEFDPPPLKKDDPPP
jgi:hypothetical protein